MLSRRDVDHYAQSCHVDRYVAETNVVLTFVLKVLSEENPVLPLLESLAFKGGTCLRKAYFGENTRFSMDLDFTFIGADRKDFRKRIRGLLDKRTHYGISFKMEERAVGDGSGFGAKISYSHEWRDSNFEFEVSFRELPILPVTMRLLKDELYWRYCGFKPFKVNCMNMEELIAEKLRASIERTTVRDLYDLYIYSSHAFDEERVRTLAVLKCWRSGSKFDAAVLLKKFESSKYNWKNLERLVRPERMPDERKLVEDVCRRYTFLKELDTSLSIIAGDAARHRHGNLVDEKIENLKKTK